MDVSKLPIIERNLDRGKYATSCKYLRIAQRENMGPPNIMRGCEFLNRPQEGWEHIQKQVYDLLPYGTPAIFAYYPARGYIGWHDNSDAAGHTILFSHSETGNGFYRWCNGQCLKCEEETLYDDPGWTCKTGYLGTRPNSTWHCAYTNAPRWSIAYNIKSQEEYNKIIEYIC